jgi:endonuclease YncB( thermonuclease family)
MRRSDLVVFALALAACQPADVHDSSNAQHLAQATQRVVGPPPDSFDGVLPTGEQFPCTPTRVWDGDGPIWCAEGLRIRLAGIAAREMDGTCRDNQPCPVASAEAARDHLAGLLGKSIGTTSEGHVRLSGEPLTCVSAGSAGGKRTAAWCVSPVHGDLSCRMVESGLAFKWDRYWQEHRC